MTSISVIAGQLQRLPANVRRTLYSIVSLAGLVLLVVQVLGWHDLGPISVDRALQVYSLVAPAIGVVAVANVSTPPSDDEGLGEVVDDDFDFASFAPAAPDDDFSG
jgi:hypothetical protein